jgi:hypothetical protein
MKKHTEMKDILPMCNKITELFKARKYSEIDRILSEYDFSRSCDLCSESLIRFTYAGRSRLWCWEEALERAIKNISGKSRLEYLKGL